MAKARQLTSTTQLAERAFEPNSRLESHFPKVPTLENQKREFLKSSLEVFLVENSLKKLNQQFLEKLPNSISFKRGLFLRKAFYPT